MEIIYLIIGVLLGAIIGFVLAKLVNKNSSHSSQKINELEAKNQTLAENYTKVDKEKEVLEERLTNSVNHFSEQKEKIKTLEKDNLNLSTNLSLWKANHQNLETKIAEQKKEFEEVHKRLKVEFENIANKILDEKTVKFTEQNQKNLDQLLNPFNEKLKDFGQKVEETYLKGLKERTQLKEQIVSLTDLNQQMRLDAQNLTKALKNDNKTQGNWGEFILEKILEESGLKEGVEYKKQFSTINDEGKRIQPDVVIQLPDDKHIIVDSKVSLAAYESYVNEENREEKSTFLRNHILSVKNHIKGLSDKNYQSGEKFNTPDFVLMFMPVEPAFSAAIQSDSDLYQYAWDRRIVIVSPTTLLATLRTIASIWKQERQNRNIMEIAQKAGALYDKFVGFLEDMEKIEKGLNQASNAYQNSIKKLKDGAGNLIKRTEEIRKLGLRTKKQIPNQYLDDQIE